MNSNNLPKSVENLYTPPTVIEKTSRGEVTMNVYSRLLKDRIIWIGTQINEAVANGVMAQLLFLQHEDEDEDIYMYINSPGGDVNDGMGIYDTMQFVRPDIVTICAGGSYSMATLLLCSGAPGKRFALPNATIHQHPAGYGSALQGTAPDMAIKAQHLANMHRRIKEIMAEHTGQSMERITEDFNRDKYMTPKEAIEYGIIDAIISKSPR